MHKSCCPLGAWLVTEQQDPDRDALLKLHDDETGSTEWDGGQSNESRGGKCIMMRAVSGGKKQTRWSGYNGKTSSVFFTSLLEYVMTVTLMTNLSLRVVWLAFFSNMCKGGSEIFMLAIKEEHIMPQVGHSGKICLIIVTFHHWLSLLFPPLHLAAANNTTEQSIRRLRF